LATYNEIYFPTGIYLISAPLNIQAGQELFGDVASIQAAAKAPAFAFGSTVSLLTVQGNGTGKGAILFGISIVNQAPGGLGVTWSADPSSIMIDCEIVDSSYTSFPVLDLEQGGGILKNLAIEGN